VDALTAEYQSFTRGAISILLEATTALHMMIGPNSQANEKSPYLEYQWDRTFPSWHLRIKSNCIPEWGQTYSPHPLCHAFHATLHRSARAENPIPAQGQVHVVHDSRSHLATGTEH
jgi:hypothetical protein